MDPGDASPHSQQAQGDADAMRSGSVIESPRGEVVARPAVDVQLRDFEQGLLGFLGQHGLPTDAIFTAVDERLDVFNNVPRVLARIAPAHLDRSVYISRFIAAVASGLFDAALNYLWDETIFELRRRVAHYDLSYFFDNAVRNQDKRKGLGTEEDLARIDDYELILGAKEIGLISESGFRQLDLIRYYRNAASAAHPNENELTGLQLIAWLQTCVREVIELPLSDVAVEVKRLLANVKTTGVAPEQAQSIAAFFLSLTQEQANSLASGFFGIYTRPDTTEQTRQNIRLLLPPLWALVDGPTRAGFGTKYGRFVANNEQPAQLRAREFLETVSALSYMPEALRAAEIDRAIDNLLSAHRGWNNFYNEPPFARALADLVGAAGASVPAQVRTPYVLALVEVFLGNGYGVSHGAEPYYRHLLTRVDADEALIAILSFTHTEIASRLQAPLCEKRFRALIDDLMAPKVTAPVVKDLIEAIHTFPAPLWRMKDDERIKRRLVPLRTILGSQAVGGV